MFSFLLRGQKRKDLQRDDSQDNLCAQKDMLLNKRSVLGSACCYLFSFLSKENKSKNKLCVLRGSAVGIVLSKTLSGSPFKPPFLGVVVDFFQKNFFLPYA
jgi:hypothetical protein